MSEESLQIEIDELRRKLTEEKLRADTLSEQRSSLMRTLDKTYEQLDRVLTDHRYYVPNYRLRTDGTTAPGACL